MNHPHYPDDDHTNAAAADDSSGSVGAWTLVWTLVTMKIVTIVVVMLAARRAEAGTLFAVITWHWLVVLGALLAAPVLFRLRLRRVRARRELLLRSEWMIEDAVAAGSPGRIAAPSPRRPGLKTPGSFHKAG